MLSFNIKWSKSNTAERVTRAQVTLFFNYVASGATQLGMASAAINGYSIADASIAGILTIERGTGQGAITDTSTTFLMQISHLTATIYSAHNCKCHNL